MKQPKACPFCGDCISRESVSGCVSTMYYKGLGKQKSLEYILKSMSVRIADSTRTASVPKRTKAGKSANTLSCRNVGTIHLTRRWSE